MANNSERERQETLEFVRIGVDEIQMRETLFRQRDCLFVAVNAHAVCRLHRRQEVAAFAADVQDPASGPYDEAENFFKHDWTGRIALMRLAIPIGVTASFVYLLTRLDKRWQSEAAPLQETVAPRRLRGR